MGAKSALEVSNLLQNTTVTPLMSKSFALRAFNVSSITSLCSSSSITFSTLLYKPDWMGLCGFVDRCPQNVVPQLLDHSLQFCQSNFLNCRPSFSCDHVFLIRVAVLVRRFSSSTGTLLWTSAATWELSVQFPV